MCVRESPPPPAMCVHTCTHVLGEKRREPQILRSWSYRQLWAIQSGSWEPKSSPPTEQTALITKSYLASTAPRCIRTNKQCKLLNLKSAGYDETVSFFLLFLGIPNPGRVVQKTLFSFLSRLENTISLKNQVPLWTKRSASSGMPFPLPERAAEKLVPKTDQCFHGAAGKQRQCPSHWWLCVGVGGVASQQRPTLFSNSNLIIIWGIFL